MDSSPKHVPSIATLKHYTTVEKAMLRAIADNTIMLHTGNERMLVDLYQDLHYIVELKQILLYPLAR